MDVAALFLAESREYLTGHYLPKIRAAVERLAEADLWWRPNPESNSVGNLLLHLAGNLGQWIVTGVGGAPDRRDRPGEFAARDPVPAALLLERLTATIQAADRVLAGFPPERLLEPRVIQGRDVTALAAIYHAIEHLALHAGQVIYIAKLRSGQDLGFYRLEDGIPRPAWPGHPTEGTA